MTTIYVDNNATTPVAPEVYEVMKPYFEGLYFNPSSMYEEARDVADGVKDARRTVARFLHAGTPSQILFTSCATESNCTAIFGAVKANPRRRHIITTAVEHPAVLEVCKDLQRQGYKVTFLPVDRNGNINIRDFVHSLTSNTLLVSIMHANNETGVVFPIEQLSRITKETDPQILFHTDATQTVGKLPVDLKNEFQHVDMLSFSGHKLHAPKGVGALFIRRGTPCRPFLIGGHQEGNRRGGTENVPYVVGLARACKLADEHREDELRIQKLRDKVEKSIMETIPYVEINGRETERLPNTLNMACHFVEGESILYQLNQHGICASSGSACTSGSLEPSHVLRAMDIPFTAMHGSIRLSFSRYNTEAEADKLIEVLPAVIAALRKMSPYWDQANDCPREDIEEIKAPK